MRYAEKTTVSSAKSRAEIETIITKYKASEFASGWAGNKALIGFKMRERHIKFTLQLPDRQSTKYTHIDKWRKRSEAVADAQWEQDCRQRWRALALIIKAKLEAIECGIVEFDQEMMPFIVTDSGLTVYEEVQKQYPSLLTGAPMMPAFPPA
jgi:hypothetical protein